MGWWKVQSSARCDEGTRPQQNRCRVDPARQIGPAGERQEHLDAVVSSAGAGRRRRLFRGLDIPTMKWATGDLPEEQEVDPKKVRPIQTGQPSRKCVSRRLLALNEGEVAAPTTAVRQLGVGSPVTVGVAARNYFPIRLQPRSRHGKTVSNDNIR